MKHVYEYALFEGRKVKREDTTDELNEKFPELAYHIKTGLTRSKPQGEYEQKERYLKYWITRGFEAKLGVKKIEINGESNYHLTIEPLFEGIPPILLHLFYIPIGCEKFANMKPIRNVSQSKLIELDFESINNSFNVFNQSIKKSNLAEIIENVCQSCHGGTCTWEDVKKKNIGEFELEYKRYYCVSNYISGIFKMMLKYFKYMSKEVIEDVELKDLLDTEEYKKIKDFGYESATTDIIWKNRNFKIQEMNPHRFHNMTIYSNGPIRSGYNRMAIITKPEDSKIIKNMNDWRERLDWIYQYIRRKTAKDMGITSHNELNRLGEEASLDEYMKELANSDISKFIEWAIKLPTESRVIKPIVDQIYLYIKSDPGKAGMELKGYSDVPLVKKAMSKYYKEVPEFEELFDVAAGLTKLGF